MYTPLFYPQGLFMRSSAPSTLPRWAGIVITLAMVIIVRESAVWVCTALGMAKAANIVGMVAMFLLLILWRVWRGLPSWLTNASSTLLVDSGFAFLPVSAGAGLILFGLGAELWGVLATIAISTLIPLWGLAHMSKRALQDTHEATSQKSKQGASS